MTEYSELVERLRMVGNVSSKEMVRASLESATVIESLERRVTALEIALRDIRWHAKHGDVYAAATCGNIADEALAKGE